MMLVLQTLAAFVAIMAFGVMVEVPRKYLPWCGVLGAVCSLAFNLLEGWSGSVASTFISALITAWLAHIFARKLKVPVTVLLIPGILPLVPGMYLYRCVNEFFFGTQKLAAHNLVMALELAGMIALGIFVVDSFYYFPKKRSCQ